MATRHSIGTKPLRTRSDAEPEPLSTGAFWRIVTMFALAAAVFLIASHLLNDIDYIGKDPDDSMRLVEVRDLLSGQSWFDLHQYRMGLDGGTLMHWSRLIDLPIASLIWLFRLVLASERAEAAAALAWPSLLLLPLMASMGLAGYRLGGRQAMLMTLGLTVLFVVAIPRFRPGALDHHNVQLVLAAFIAAMLIDPAARARDFALAGLAAAVALAIGAETTPLIAVAAFCVALLWGSNGRFYRAGAVAFGLSFATCATILFVATTPVHLWASVTCDTLSIGYLSMVMAGGMGLAFLALVIRSDTAALRLGGLAVLGIGIALLARYVAPQCLGNPLAGLDPLLKELWLNNVTEAQPITREIVANPGTFGGFYAVGLLAIAVCLANAARGRDVEAHGVLAALIAISWLVSAIQVRGMIFSNLLSAIPMGFLISELRSAYRERKHEPRLAIAFVLASLASIPTVWTFAGASIASAAEAMTMGHVAKHNAAEETCLTRQAMQALADLPPGRMLAPANPGSLLLRFTPHSVLSANYHRNEAGMLAALKISLADPAVAARMIDDAHVDYVLYCDNDPQLGIIRAQSPNGFLTRIGEGEIPVFLEPVTIAGGNKLKLFRVLR